MQQVTRSADSFDDVVSLHTRERVRGRERERARARASERESRQGMSSGATSRHTCAICASGSAPVPPRLPSIAAELGSLCSQGHIHHDLRRCGLGIPAPLLMKL